MSVRRYYQDAFTTTFAATVIEKTKKGDQVAVSLDQTYFYPNSGGQPADRGEIGGARVLDVFIREADGAIFHLLERDPANSGPLQAQIDWTRRFDHMQQHTGQHILSQAFIRMADAETIGFHLSDNSVTIDLDRANLTEEQIAAAETLANAIIWENRPVLIHFVSQEDARHLPLRKLPEATSAQLRLIEIEEFDLTACGGTHVAATGSVGLIKLLKTERRGEKLRVEFVCGRRAWEDYGLRQRVVGELMAEFTTGAEQLTEAVRRLRVEATQMQRALKKARAERQQFEALRLVQEGRRVGDIIVITQVYQPEDEADLPGLARQMNQRDGCLALLGLAGSKTQLVFTRSPDAPGDMRQVLRAAFSALGQGGGGGSETFAQGGGGPATTEEVWQALTAAETAVFPHPPSDPGANQA
jgi:alanyl-tRNA synthetase